MVALKTVGTVRLLALTHLEGAEKISREKSLIGSAKQILGPAGPQDPL